MSSRVPFWSKRWSSGTVTRPRSRGKFGGLPASKIARLVDLPTRQVWEALREMEKNLGRELQEPEVGRFIGRVWEVKDEKSIDSHSG